MRRVAPWLAGLALACVVASGCSSTHQVDRPAHRPASSGAARPVAARTVVHTVTPYRPDGTATVPSVRSVSGYCWDSSLATAGPAAFRCFGDAGPGAQILDPCFASPTPKPATVSCVPDPWSDATTLHLTRALPAPVSGEVTRPWALELTGGVRCLASTGTVPVVAGVNLSYHCVDGTAAAVLRTDTASWPAVDARPDATTLDRVTVVAAWRT